VCLANLSVAQEGFTRQSLLLPFQTRQLHTSTEMGMRETINREGAMRLGCQTTPLFAGPTEAARQGRMVKRTQRAIEQRLTGR
jgi:hypothetical protein